MALEVGVMSAAGDPGPGLPRRWVGGRAEGERRGRPDLGRGWRWCPARHPGARWGRRPGPRGRDRCRVWRRSCRPPRPLPPAGGSAPPAGEATGWSAPSIP